jgi:hypothetical protein
MSASIITYEKEHPFIMRFRQLRYTSFKNSGLFSGTRRYPFRR